MTAFQREFGDNLQNTPLSRTVRKRRKAHAKSVKKLRQKFDHTDEQYDRSVKQLQNEKRRQKHRLIRENLERYKNEQLVIESERQLSGKVINGEVIGALQRTGYITPQHMTLIDSTLTMPGTTIEKEYERRITTINAVIAACDAEEGAPCGLVRRKNALSILLIYHLLPYCLRDRSLPLQTRVLILFLEKRDQRYVLFVLVMLDCQKVNA